MMLENNLNQRISKINMKKWVIFFMLCIPLVSAQTYDRFQESILNFKIGSEIELVPMGETPRLDSLNVLLKLYPREDQRQEILTLNLHSQPPAEAGITGEGYKYSWSAIAPRYKYSLRSTVKIENNLDQIKFKIPFPQQDIKGELETYKGEGEFIDINDKIRNKAEQLTKGKTDYYEAVFAIAVWIQNNVEYDLSTITSSAVQKSSWVFENKVGVCDELTNLFISMLRSVGIPARFVTGTVFSGTIEEGWGNHGWAEVYFPGHGWVPWDVTFGQYGWVDTSHLKLVDTLDSGESSVEYNWRSFNYDLKANDLKLITSLEKNGEQFDDKVQIEIKPIEERLTFDSYIPLQAIIENLNDHYLSTTIFLAKGPKVDDNTKQILLKPNEIKTLFWISKVPGGLDDEFEYSSELEVWDSFGASDRGKVFFTQKGKKFTLAESNALLQQQRKRDEKKPFTNILTTCNYEERDYFPNEEVNIICEITNRGRDILESITICLENNCQQDTIANKEKKTYEYALEPKEIFLFLIEDDQFIKKETINLNVIKLLELYITSIEPSTVDYNVLTDVSFDLNSDYQVHDITLKVKGVGKMNVDRIEGKKPVTFTINSKKLVSGLEVEITYKDQNEREHTEKKHYPLVVENIPSIVKTWIKFKNLF